MFESSAAPVAAKTSAIPAGAEAKGQKVHVQLPKKSAAGIPKSMPSSLNRPETKRLADDREAMRRLREESRILDEQQEANKREKQRLQEELKTLRQKRRAEESARKEQEEITKKKKADDEAAAKRKEAEVLAAKKKADEKALAEESAKSARKKAEKAEKKARKEAKREKEEEEAQEKEEEEEAQEDEKEGPGEDMALEDYPGMWLIEYKPEGWVAEWNRRTAEIQAKLKEEYHQELAQKIARQKRLPEVARLLGIPLHEAEKPFQRLQEQRAIPIETDPWARPAQFWNRPWKQVCEESKLVEKSTGKTVYFCGSQSDQTAFWQHLNSKCGTAGHPAKKVIQSWNSDKEEFEPVRDLERAQLQQTQREKMFDAIKRANKAIEAMTKRAHGKDEEESSTSAESEDSQGGDEVIQEAKKFGLTIKKLPPGAESKEEVLDIPDRKALRQFFQAKREEKDALKAKAEEGKEKSVEESTEHLSEKAKTRRAGMSAFGARMLSCTLDQVIEEIPGEMKGIEELVTSPTSPAGEVEAVEESNVIPSGEVTMPVAAMTEKASVPAPETAPQDEDRHLCRACQGTGRSTSDMNAAVAIILEAQAKSLADSEAQAKALAEASQVSAVKEEKEGGESSTHEDSKRRGDFTVSIGKAQNDLIVLELCCGKGSELAQAA